MKRLFLLVSIIFQAIVTCVAQNNLGHTFAVPSLQHPENFKGFDCVNLLDSTFVDVESTGSGSFAVCKSVQMLTSAGALSHRIIKYDYDPLTAHAEFVFVRITKANGEEIQLDVNRQLDYAAPARMIYWGARQIMMEIGRLECGDILTYQIAKKGFTYALLDNMGSLQTSNSCGQSAVASCSDSLADDDSRFIPPMRGHFYDIVPMWVDHPTLRKVYKVNLPMEKDLQFQVYQGECTSSMRYEDGKKSFTFACSEVMPIKREPNMVDLYDCAPKLMLSTTPCWKDKSLWFNRVNENYGSFKALPEAQKLVDDLLRGKRTEMEKISVLTHWVADNIRYAGISMGKGEGFTLHNLKMNFTDRCGVCKDIAGTLVSFLRMAGFEAYPAMTMAGSRVESIPADHFNHCVAVVKLSDGTYIPLDPTWVPFCRELWSSAEQQQNYLPGIPEGSNLCQTPISAPENHYLRFKANHRLDAHGTLRGQFTVSAEGQSDLYLRRIFTMGWQSKWRDALENQLLEVSPRAKLLSVDYGRHPKDYQKAPLSITFRYEIPDYALVGEAEMLVKPMLMNNLYSRIKTYLSINTSLADRRYGFRDACSRLVEFDETIQIPTGYNLISVPRSEKSASDAADFEGSIIQHGRYIKMYQKLSLKKRVYDADDWAGFRDAVNTHKTFGDYLILKK